MNDPPNVENVSHKPLELNFTMFTLNMLLIATADGILRRKKACSLSKPVVEVVQALRRQIARGGVSPFLLLAKLELKLFPNFARWFCKCLHRLNEKGVQCVLSKASNDPCVSIPNWILRTPCLAPRFASYADLDFATTPQNSTRNSSRGDGGLRRNQIRVQGKVWLRKALHDCKTVHRVPAHQEWTIHVCQARM